MCEGPGAAGCSHCGWEWADRQCLVGNSRWRIDMVVLLACSSSFCLALQQVQGVALCLGGLSSLADNCHACQLYQG